MLGTAILVAPHDSHDLWSYTMYGRILSVHHASPWVVTPAHFHGDPYLGARRAGLAAHDVDLRPGVRAARGHDHPASAGRRRPRCACSSPTSFAGRGRGAAWIVYRRTGRAAATALVLLHPAIVLGTVAGGHNDGLVGLGLLGAVSSSSTTARSRAGLAAGAATLVKLTGGIGILALAAWALAHRGRRTADRLRGGRRRPRRRSRTSRSGRPGSRRSCTTADPCRARPRGSSRACSPGSTTATRPIRLGLPVSDTQLLVTVGALVTVVLTARGRGPHAAGRPPRGRRSSPRSAPTSSSRPYVLPWYPAWVIPALALVIDRPVARLLAAQASVLVVVYELKTQSLLAPPRPR